MSLVVKNTPAHAGNSRDVGLIPGSGRSLEEEMATHSSIHTWKIPWTEEPSRLQSMGSKRVGHDWAHTHLPCCKCFASNYSDMHEIQIVVMLSSRIQNTLLALSTIFCRVLSLGPSFSAPLSTQLKYPRLISILTAPFLPVSITGTYPTCIPSSYCRY